MIGASTASLLNTTRENAGALNAKRRMFMLVAALALAEVELARPSLQLCSGLQLQGYGYKGTAILLQLQVP